MSPTATVLVRAWRIGMLSGMMMLAGVGSTAAQSGPASLDQLLERGDALYAQYQNDEAHTLFVSAYEVAAESFDVLARLARTTVDFGMDLEADGEMDRAASLYEEAMGYADALERLYPDSAETYFHLIRTRGKLALFRGGKEKVETGRHIERYCQRGLELDENDPDIQVSYGIFQREVADLSWIERTFARALFGAVPSGTKEEAVRALLRAIELRPDFAFAYYELGVTYMGMGDQKRAGEAFRASLDLPASTTQDIRNRVIARRMLERLP
ncbi:MAG: tetratricopeptide repeat protein [Rhodothermales bacterium]|nr:tetratricopeptide repeat protein [Rhodothermales bacterium]